MAEVYHGTDQVSSFPAEIALAVTLLAALTTLGLEHNLSLMNEISRSTVLVVEDTEPNVDILVNALDDEYEVSVALDGQSSKKIR